MKRLFTIIKYVRLLSLDIVAGALAGAIMACKILDVALPREYWFALPLSVWIIYLTDHLVDCYQSHKKNDPRGMFFYKYRNFFWKLITAIFIVDVIFIYQLPRPILYFGSVGGLIVLFYLVMNVVQNRKNIYLIPREAIVSIIYIYGTWGMQWIIAYHEISINKILFTLAYFLVITANVLIFSFFEYQKDLSNNVLTVAVKFGEQFSRKTALIFTLLSIVTIVILTLSGREINLIHSAVIIAISIVYLFITIKSETFRNNGLYGVVADFSLILPVIAFFV